MSDTLKNLLEDRARAWEQAKPILDAAEAENRSLTAEEQQNYDRLDGEIASIDERVESITERLEREAAADSLRERAERFLGTDEGRQSAAEDSLETQALKFFRSEEGQRGFEVPVKGMAFERDEERQAWEVRDLLKGSGTGGQTVASTFRRQLYVHLIENSGIRQTRATVLTTGNGEQLIMPKTLTHPTAPATITAEAGGIAENEPTFGQGTLSAYKYARMIQLSSELIQDTAVDLLGYLAAAFGQALGNATGAKYILGTGSSEPTGLLVSTLAGTVTGGTGVSGAPTGDNIIDLTYTLTEPYAQNAEFLMRRATVGAVRKLKDTAGQYLWQPSLQVGAPDTLLGYPIRTDPNMPANAAGAGTLAGTSIAFGDFSKFIIRDVGSFRWERSDDFAFANDLVSWRAIVRTDSLLLDSNAVVAYKGGTA
jgi:HK97 family phage major capsid protein